MSILFVLPLLILRAIYFTDEEQYPGFEGNVVVADCLIGFWWFCLVLKGIAGQFNHSIDHITIKDKNGVELKVINLKMKMYMYWQDIWNKLDWLVIVFMGTFLLVSRDLAQILKT